MRGLKTQESEKFNRFHELIQKTANKQGMVWFAFAGEGNDFKTDEMEGEDVSGWLIPKKSADEFEKQWIKNHDISTLERWEDFFIWAEWRKAGDGTISIEFVRYA